MLDQSFLDRKYFLDEYVYNCPFCNRDNVSYSITSTDEFDWSKSKKCYIIIVKCNSCGSLSLHLSYQKITGFSNMPYEHYYFTDNTDIDSKFFYSVPTSFFVIDNRIPKIIRELISEAEGCLKMNFLTGASACMRKAIYELLVLEKTTEDHYETRIKQLNASRV